MTAVTRADVETALKGYVDPYLDQDLIAAKCVKAIQIDGSRLTLDIELGYPAAGYRDTLTAALRERLSALPAISWRRCRRFRRSRSSWRARSSPTKCRKA